MKRFCSTKRMTGLTVKINYQECELYVRRRESHPAPAKTETKTAELRVADDREEAFEVEDFCPFVILYVSPSYIHWC